MSPIRMRWRQNSRRAVSSSPNHSKIPMTVCVDLNSKTLTVTFSFSVALVHERPNQIRGIRPRRVLLGTDRPTVVHAPIFPKLANRKPADERLQRLIAAPNVHDPGRTIRRGAAPQDISTRWLTSTLNE